MQTKTNVQKNGTLICAASDRSWMALTSSCEPWRSYEGSASSEGTYRDIKIIHSNLQLRSERLNNYYTFPVACMFPIGVIITLLGGMVYRAQRQKRAAFFLSSLYFFFMLAGAAYGQYPALLPSASDSTRISL